MAFFELHRPDWESDGLNWPNREASRFVEAAGLRWHLQEFGSPQAPTILLVHGIGAATHSWRSLAPLLAEQFRVIAPDLPGHGFTEPTPKHRSTLDGLAHSLGALLAEMGAKPQLAIGHAAGAVLLLRLCLDGSIDPAVLIAVNGALEPAQPGERLLYRSLARLLLLNSVTPTLIAWIANRAVMRPIFDRAGSRIDRVGLDRYKLLMAKSGHVAGALGMMANWDLETLARDFPRLRQRMVLLTGAADRAVLPDSASRMCARFPDARVVSMDGLGHLAHEEAPARVADLVLEEARKVGLLPDAAPAS